MFLRILKYCAFVILGFIWIYEPTACENDFNTCSFYYWKVDWHSAMRMCQKDHKQLLCYKSKKEIDDITEAFRLSAVGDAELELWLSYWNCSGVDKTEECLSLHIEKSPLGVWHYFQKNCKPRLPFICCINGTDQTTTIEPVTFTDTPYVTSNDYDQTNTTMDSTSSTTFFRTFACNKVWKRGVLWPNTDIGKVSVRPCPGKSTGTARWVCKNLHNGGWAESGPDMTECRSLEIQNIKDKFNSSSASELIDDLENVFKDHGKEIFSEDMIEVISLMTSLPNRLFDEMESLPSSARWTSTKSSVEKSMSVLDRVIELNATWNDIGEVRRSGVGTSLLSTVDGMGSLLADAMTYDAIEQSITGKNVAMQVTRTRYGEAVQLPQWEVTSDYSRRGSVLLGQGYDIGLDSSRGNISIVFTLYTDMAPILSPGGKTNEKSRTPSSLNSAVISATVTQGRRPVIIKKEARIVVEHLIANPNQTACVFWNMQLDRWDTTGCRLEGSNGTYSLCVCDHLTNFALLMDYQNLFDQVDQLPFHYITVIGCTISIISLFLCVIIFSCYSYHSRHSWGLRYVIHLNLCLTLLIANMLLVFGLDKTENSGTCAVIAGMLHYFFLSAFSWMLLEGVHIYLLLVIVFASRRSHSEKYYIFGYGFPLVIVAITAISRSSYYGTNEVCWLSAEKGTRWAFMGPVAGILLLNTAALFLAQWKASRISIKDDNVALIKRWLRVTFILFPILGITWIFGFLYVGRHFEVAGYFFAVFNSLQGFCIFVFHCLLDKKARNMVLTSFKKKSSSVNTGSSGTQRKMKDPKELQNGRTSNLIKAKESENRNKASMFHKAFHLPLTNTWKKDWGNWKKPWSFCFEMPVSENNPAKVQENEESPPEAVIVHWNNLREELPKSEKI